MADPADISALSLADFEPDLGAIFSVPLADGTLPLRLTEATGGPHGLRAGGAFSLIFTGEAGPRLAQGTWALAHPRLGLLHLFLVPVLPVAGAAQYQAVFA